MVDKVRYKEVLVLGWFDSYAQEQDQQLQCVKLGQKARKVMLNEVISGMLASI